MNETVLPDKPRMAAKRLHQLKQKLQRKLLSCPNGRMDGWIEIETGNTCGTVQCVRTTQSRSKDNPKVGELHHFYNLDFRCGNEVCVFLHLAREIQM